MTGRQTISPYIIAFPVSRKYCDQQYLAVFNHTQGSSVCSMSPPCQCPSGDWLDLLHTDVSLPLPSSWTHPRPSRNLPCPAPWSSSPSVAVWGLSLEDDCWELVSCSLLLPPAVSSSPTPGSTALSPPHCHPLHFVSWGHVLRFSLIFLRLFSFSISRFEK
jgi:hypothetical protein